MSKEGDSKLDFNLDDDEVHFLLDLVLIFDSGSSLIQQFAGRHVDPLGHIIPIQLVFVVNPYIIRPW